MHTITRLLPEDFRDSVADLAAVLADAVADGASLGFVGPFDEHTAAAWWLTQEPAVEDGSLVLWVAHGGGGVAGTVGLAFNRKPNGRHRAEIVKLMVHRDARGQGLARALLAAAEQAAAEAGAGLLLLDTQAGSDAERLYEKTGWTRYGIVPDYAADPAGSLQDGSFYYKRVI